MTDTLIVMRPPQTKTQSQNSDPHEILKRRIENLPCIGIKLTTIQDSDTKLSTSGRLQTVRACELVTEVQIAAGSYGGLTLKVCSKYNLTILY